MNDLVDKIIIKYKNNYIEEDKIFLKMEVTLEEEEKKEEKEEKEKEDENNKNKYFIEIKKII